MNLWVEDAFVCGNLFAPGLEANIIANIANVALICAMTLRTNLIESKTTTGNILIGDDLIPDSPNVTLGDPNSPFDELYVTDIISNGNIITEVLAANIISSLMIETNSMNAKVTCSNTIITDLILPKTDGNVELDGIDVGADFIPTTTDTYDLGNSDHKWANITTQDMTVCGNLNAGNIGSTSIVGNVSIEGNVSIQGEIIEISCFQYTQGDITTSNATQQLITTVNMINDQVCFIRSHTVATNDANASEAKSF